MLSKKVLLKLADFLPRWGENNPTWIPGVEAVCIAGGGEPLINPAIADFIDRLIQNGIEVGVVTNGLMIYRYIDALSQCTWIGVSIDAATRETYNKLKGLPPDNDTFDRVIENISILSDYARRQNKKLGSKHPSYGVSYKVSFV